MAAKAAAFEASQTEFQVEGTASSSEDAPAEATEEPAAEAAAPEAAEDDAAETDSE